MSTLIKMFSCIYSIVVYSVEYYLQALSLFSTSLCFSLRYFNSLSYFPVALKGENCTEQHKSGELLIFSRKCTSRLLSCFVAVHKFTESVLALFGEPEALARSSRNVLSCPSVEYTTLWINKCLWDEHLRMGGSSRHYWYSRSSHLIPYIGDIRLKLR